MSKKNRHNSENNENLDITQNFGIQDDEIQEFNIDGKETTLLPQISPNSEFDKIIDEQNGEESSSPKEAINDIPSNEASPITAEQDSEEDSHIGHLSPKEEKKIQKTNAKDAAKIFKGNEYDPNNDEHREIDPETISTIRDTFGNSGLHYINAFDIDLDKIEPINLKKRKYQKNTNLFINTRVYNRFIEYNASDFTPTQIKDLFIDLDNIDLPNDSGFTLQLYPNDTEKTLKVEVFVSKFYKYGEVVENRKAFSPFWISGFNEPVLYASTIRPLEKNYRVNEANTFAYRETTKILNKKIAAKYISLSRDKNATEQDFKEAQALKNSYIQHHIERLNMINSVEWECVPDLYMDWRNKRVVIKLYLKILSTIDYSRLPRYLYVDSFNVNLNDLMDVSKQQATSFDDNPRYKKSSKTLIDINTICYLIALNAMYKNILIFSYNTLYECYKTISYQVLKKGYDLKQITHANLSTLKIIDFSKHFVCQKKMFDDRLLHLMNLKSSHEEYYQMKYIYTMQKNPHLLYSDFIVKEFEKVKINELAYLLRNEEEKAWRKRLEALKASEATANAPDKDFFINNYNVFDYSHHESRDIESFLMNVIREDKDEIARIAALGKEVLAIDQKEFYSKKELREMQRTARRLNRIKLQ